MLRPSMFLRTSALRPARHATVRFYTTPATLAGVDPSKMMIQRTQTPSQLMKEEELVFGRTFTGTFFSTLPRGS